jgi:antitoxin VapB
MAEYRTKTFKSGNSVALRLPKGLGVSEGEEFVIVPHDGGSFTLWRKNDAKDVLMSLYGAFSPGFMAGGRIELEQEERDWSSPKRDEAA